MESGWQKIWFDENASCERKAMWQRNNLSSMQELQTKLCTQIRSVVLFDDQTQKIFFRTLGYVVSKPCAKFNGAPFGPSPHLNNYFLDGFGQIACSVAVSSSISQSLSVAPTAESVGCHPVTFLMGICFVSQRVAIISC